MVAGLVAVVLAGCLGCSADAPEAPGGTAPSPTASVPSTVAPPPAATPTPTPAALTLPRGGRTVFPTHRLVGYAGRTGSPTLGRLGTGRLDQRVEEMIERAEPYAADGRTILPVMEVIATVVQGSPGRDGMYRTRMPDRQVAAYLRAARRHRAVLLLAIQPGRSEFRTEVEAYERWLREPDVGVALDPEWAMDRDDVPGRTFGHTTGRELDGVSRYLSGLTTQHGLPEKIMVFHELAPQIVTDEGGLKPHRGVAVVKSVDGIGVPAAKVDTYRRVYADSPDFVRPGFKLFYDEDRETGPLMKPAEVLRLRPRPEYVLYE